MSRALDNYNTLLRALGNNGPVTKQPGWSTFLAEQLAEILERKLADDVKTIAVGWSAQDLYDVIQLLQTPPLLPNSLSTTASVPIPPATSSAEDTAKLHATRTPAKKPTRKPRSRPTGA